MRARAAADQARRIGEVIWHSLGERGMHGKVTVGMYVGGEGQHQLMGPEHVIDKGKQLVLDPPDVLLTNYKMLDFLLLRPKDRGLWQRNRPDTLRKGLEFPQMFVAGVNHGIVPLPSSELGSDDPVVARQALKRERCLLYVASSRARDRLYASCSGTPSPFLSES